MKKGLYNCFILGLFATSVCFSRSVGAQGFPFNDTTLTVERRVDDLLSRLTLDEKVAFLEHSNPAVERLGIEPYSWWNEALHGVARNGVATVYPMPVALAASFFPEMVEEVYSRVADEGVRKHRESRRAGEYGDNTGITYFTPNINIFRDPRWGRGMETFGEDPFLTARMGLAAVRGLQGSPKFRTPTGAAAPQSQYLVAAACLKHLAVHSGPEGKRHSFDAVVDDSDLWNTYLPAFEYVVKNSNVQQVMCGYNRLNGKPCCTNHHLLVDILRNRWHYDGIVVTDCWALNDCWEPDTVIVRHRTHPTAASAAGDAFGSEVDLECGSGYQALRDAVDSGYVSESQIDVHLRRVLSTRFRLRPELFSATSCQGESLAESPKDVAAKTLVMLKNSGVLPLAGEGTRVALLGPNFADSAMALGNYNGTPPYVVTIQRALESLATVAYSDTACHLADTGYRVPTDFWARVESCDVVVFCGGLSPELEGEELQVDLPGFYKGDRTRIELPTPQRDMIKALRQRTAKPIVLVICTGGAIALEEVADDVDAILVAWYGGQEMGSAVAEALTGRANDFGRLPVTFYRSTEQLPDFADYSMRGRTYRYMDEEPLYPFGYGLTYSDFSYEGLRFDRSTMTLSGTLRLDGCRSLTGGGSECILVFLKDPTYAGGPRRRLVGVQRRTIASVGDSVMFSITIDPFWLRRYNASTDSMELPPDGTPMVLQLGTGQEIGFTW